MSNKLIVFCKQIYHTVTNTPITVKQISSNTFTHSNNKIYLHVVLCLGQSSFWHLLLQYLTFLHAEHRSRLDDEL